MLGPVLQLEWLRACTRGKHHRLRQYYHGLLTVECLIFASLLFVRLTFDRERPPSALFFGFFQILIAQHFFLVMLLPAAFVAGSVADEKTRGTLVLLMTTPLSPMEIVVGKWLAQVTQMIVLALPAVPLMVLMSQASGLSLRVLGLAAAATTLWIVVLSAAGMLASVLCRRTSSAVLGCYAFMLLVIVGTWQAGLWQPSIWGAHFLDDSMAPDSLRLTAIALGSAAVCLVIAVWQLRPAYLRQLSARPRRRSFFWSRPAVSERQPLRWKERFAGELGLLRFLRAVPPDYARIGVFILSAVCSVATALVSHRLFLTQSVIFTFVVALTVAVRASGVISGERERQTWETLLSTPLTPYDIIRGKLWGIIDSTRPYLAGYIIPAVAVACFLGPMAVFWTVYWWLATWVALYFLGAVGMRASANSSGSWHSLLKTITSAGGLILQRWFFILIPLSGCLNALVMMVGFGPGGLGPAAVPGAMLVSTIFVVSVFLAILFGKTELLLQEAEQTIDKERVADNQLLAMRPVAEADQRSRKRRD